MTGTNLRLGEVGYVARSLARSPAFSGAVVATLSVAIAANVAIFAIVNALVFRPLPYPDVDRLATVASTPQGAVRRMGLSYPDYADYRDRARSLEGLGLAGARSYVMNAGDQAALVSGARSTADLFRVIGLSPLVGRVFSQLEDRPGGGSVVVLGQRLWERSFGRDPSVVGRVIRLDGLDCTVIGVMPADFAYPDHAELWVPLAADPLHENRGTRTFAAIARLRAGATVEGAASELRRIAADLAREHPATNSQLDVLVAGLGGIRGPRGLLFAFLVALAAGGFVLAIACANVANLLLARMTVRTREFAIRSALGATRGNIVRLLLIEAAILAAPAAALGLLLGEAGRDALIGMVPSGIPTWMRFDTDWRLLAFTLGMAAVAAIGVAASPGVRALRRPPLEGLKATRPAVGTRRNRLVAALVVCQVALTLVLLVGAGLMIRSFLAVAAIDPGFEPGGLLTFQVPLPSASYAPERRVSLFQSLAARVAALPSVSAVGMTSALPLVAEGHGVDYQVGGMALPGRVSPQATRGIVDDHYFGTMGIPIVAGRAFDRRDRSDGPAVAIVSAALAARHWPPGEAVGQRLRLPGTGSESPWLTVVGVAGDIHSWRVEDTSLPWVYVPLAQAAQSSMRLVVRSGGDVAALAAAIRAELARIDPDLAVMDLLPFDAAIRRSLWAERLFTYVFEVFGVVALALALVGLYGVISYAVAQRTTEIGIRAALGARRSSLVWLVLRDGARLALAGVVIGTVAAYGATRALAGLLYGVTPHDASTFGVVAALVLAVCSLAAYVPARRAARMDPLRALREG